jgi:hypothetical protein
MSTEEYKSYNGEYENDSCMSTEEYKEYNREHENDSCMSTEEYKSTKESTRMTAV